MKPLITGWKLVPSRCIPIGLIAGKLGLVLGATFGKASIQERPLLVFEDEQGVPGSNRAPVAGVPGLFFPPLFFGGGGGGGGGKKPFFHSGAPGQAAAFVSRNKRRTSTYPRLRHQAQRKGERPSPTVAELHLPYFSIECALHVRG